MEIILKQDTDSQRYNYNKRDGNKIIPKLRTMLIDLDETDRPVNPQKYRYKTNDDTNSDFWSITVETIIAKIESTLETYQNSKDDFYYC